MPRRSGTPPKLVVPRAEAAQKIQAQIEKGRKIKNLFINSEASLERANAVLSKGEKYNTELLRRLFDNTSIADEYSYVGPIVVSSGRPFGSRVKDLRDNVDNSISKLESILERLDLIPEMQIQSKSIKSATVVACPYCKADKPEFIELRNVGGTEYSGGLPVFRGKGRLSARWHTTNAPLVAGFLRFDQLLRQAGSKLNRRVSLINFRI